MRPIYWILLVAGTSPAGALAAGEWETKGEAIYKSVCASCHDQGVLDAPKIGDAESWKPRLAEGQKAITRLAIKGIRKMPPRGGNPSLSDDEVAAAVAHLANRSGGKFSYPE